MEAEIAALTKYSNELLRILTLSNPTRTSLTTGLYSKEVIDIFEKNEIMELSSQKSADKVITYMVTRLGTKKDAILEQLNKVEMLRDIVKKINGEISRLQEEMLQSGQQPDDSNEAISNAGVSTTKTSYESIDRRGGEVTKAHLGLLSNKLWDLQPYWEQFAHELPVKNFVIQGIKTSHPQTTSKDKFQQVMETWRMKGGTRTWRVIHTALTNVRKNNVAENVLKKYPDLDTNVPFEQDSYISIMTDVLRDVIPLWSLFALQLGLSNSEVQEIKGEGGLLAMSLNDLLEQWISLKGSDANIIDIIRACDRMGYRDLSWKLKMDAEMCNAFPVLVKIDTDTTSAGLCSQDNEGASLPRRKPVQKDQHVPMQTGNGDLEENTEPEEEIGKGNRKKGKSGLNKKHLAVIITNTYEGSGRALPGVMKDRDELYETFDSQEFELIKAPDCSRSAMVNLPRQVEAQLQKRVHFAPYKSIFVVFSGHGGLSESSIKGYIVSNDGEEMDVEEYIGDYIEVVKNSKQNIPKYFLIDSCRGAEIPPSKGPGDNCLIAYSTTLGNKVSCPKDGSYWIIKVARKLREENDTVASIIHRVNEEVKNDPSLRIRQIPIIAENSLSETLNLFQEGNEDQVPVMEH